MDFSSVIHFLTFFVQSFCYVFLRFLKSWIDSVKFLVSQLFGSFQLLGFRKLKKCGIHTLKKSGNFRNSEIPDLVFFWMGWVGREVVARIKKMHFFTV